MESIPRSRLNADMPFLPSLKRAMVSISCPDCQSDVIRRSRTRGIAESLLAYLRIRPYRCEECDHRFFHWSLQHKPKATWSARRSNARDC